jgi:pimeloyl-ACP methyl ester carboxylesterase
MMQPGANQRPNCRIAMSTETLSIATTDGLRLHALWQGASQRPTVVLVHGYPDNLHVWAEVVAALENRYCVVRYDVRGAGRSDAPPDVRGYRLAQLAADFRRVIDRVSPDEPVHLVGHDWGSIQSWEFATEPALAGRIASFTSISGPCLDHIAHAARRRGFSAATLRQFTASWYIGLMHLPLLGASAWRFGLDRQWPRVLARLERLRAVPQHATQQRDGRNGIGLYRANMLPRFLKPRARHAHCPVQLVVLKRDPFISPMYLEGIERWADNLHTVTLDAGHWLPLSQPLVLAQQVDGFIRRQTPQP